LEQALHPDSLPCSTHNHVPLAGLALPRRPLMLKRSPPLCSFYRPMPLLLLSFNSVRAAALSGLLYFEEPLQSLISNDACPWNDFRFPPKNFSVRSKKRTRLDFFFFSILVLHASSPPATEQLSIRQCSTLGPVQAQTFHPSPTNGSPAGGGFLSPLSVGRS